MAIPQDFDLKAELKKCKTAEDLTGKNGLLQRLVGGMLEQLLQEVLGIWIGEAEGAKFWLKVCTELQNRGVKDVLIACMDGLKALPDAIRMVFPEVEIQLCIIHMIRNSIKYIPHHCSKEFMTDLKDIYKASTEEIAYQNLEKLQKKWESKYALAVKPWLVHWDNIKTFFSFPEQIRRLIYTTNAVETVHRQLRKVTKNKAVFPTDESLVKMVFLAVRDVSKKWTMPLHGWKTIISHLSIAYGDRLGLDA